MNHPLARRIPIWPMAGASLLLVAIALLAVILARHSRAEGTQEEGESGSEVQLTDLQAHVRVIVAHLGSLPLTLQTIGRVTPAPKASGAVVSRNAGVVASVETCDGEMTTSETVLLRLDDRLWRQQLAQAKAAFDAAQADLMRAREGGLDVDQTELELAASQAQLAAQKARREATRQAELLKDHLTSEITAVESSLAADSAEKAAKAAIQKSQVFRQNGRQAEQARLEGAVQQAKAAMNAAALDMESALIRAPRSGRLSGFNVEAGQHVEAGALLGHIELSDSFAVRLDLTPTDARLVHLGAPAAIALADGHPLSGEVISVGGGADPETGLVPAFVNFQQNSQPMLLGEALSVTIELGMSPPGVLTPISALSTSDESASLVVVDDHDIAHVKPVQILARSSDRAVVAGDGLADGARIAVDGNYNLPDGARVVVDSAP